MALHLHLPVNHQLRPFYRMLAGACGLYVLIFGIVGLVRTQGMEFFARDGLPWSMGLHTNRAFAVLSIVAGAVVLIATVIGRNVDHVVYLVCGVLFLLAGLAMLAVLRTDLNFLGFGVGTCVVSFIIGTIFCMAGLYGRSGSDTAAEQEEGFRHGTPDPADHKWKFHGPPKDPDQANSRFA